MVALSDSRVAMASSTLMVSPTFTNRSMTGTSEKSPISGTFTSTMPPRGGSSGAAGSRRGGRSRSGSSRRRGRSGRAGGFELDQHGAFGDLGAELDQHFLDHAGDGGRHVHRGLVGFEGGDGIVHLDGVADLDEQVDDRDVGEIADVRDFHFDDLAHVSSPPD